MERGFQTLVTPFYYFPHIPQIVPKIIFCVEEAFYALFIFEQLFKADVVLHVVLGNLYSNRYSSLNKLAILIFAELFCDFAGRMKLHVGIIWRDIVATHISRILQHLLKIGNDSRIDLERIVLLR